MRSDREYVSRRIGFPLVVRFWAGLALAGVLAMPSLAGESIHDLVIKGGHVVDPASGLDAIRNIGITSGRIAAISSEPLAGRESIDASGSTVGPGFIDLHAHGGTLLSGRLQAYDGVTTAIEGEVGQLPVAKAYALAEEEGRATNFGWTASWGLARMQVLAGVEADGTMNSFKQGTRDARWTRRATPAEESAIFKLVQESLDQGALGIGLISGYAPEVPHSEIQALSHMAAREGVPIMVHPRFWGGADPGGDVAATQEIIANAITTGAHWYICHLSLASVSQTQPMIAAARKKGAHIDVEVLVSETGSTFLGAEFLAPEELPHFSRGFVPSDILYYGKPIKNDEELLRLRADDPTAMIFLLHRDSEKNLEHRSIQRQSFDFAGVILGSDGMPWQDREGNYIPGDAWPLPSSAWAHPRGQATYTRFLQLWVREWKEFSLMDAFRMGSYNPARALEDEVPGMKRKGRVAVGADADLVIFDLAEINVRATLEDPLPHTEGMKYVLVHGVPVIREGILDPSARPGKAVRRSVGN
ncbi:MAG: amidohydrolase family protein [Myxococcota bacterium]|nr:amidohydrolase family protein [Myxococcota bacterium]